MNLFEKWAQKKATAIRAGRPRDVLALGTDAEEAQASHQSQIMGPSSFLAFISSTENFGLGLGTM